MNSPSRKDAASILGLIGLVMLVLSATALILTSPLQTQSGQNTLIAFVVLSTLATVASGWVLWGEQALITIEELRTPLKVSPEAVDIIIARACAEPHLARTMVQTLKNAIRSHSHRNPQALDALDVFVPSARMRTIWRLHDRTLSVEVAHTDFRIAHSRLYVRRELLPDTVVTGIDRMPLADLIEIPILRAGNIVDVVDIRMKPDAVVFDIFRDRRDIAEIIQTLEALHAKSLKGVVLNHPWTPPLGA